MNKSEELIACLEGEIAKRDEELAACRVAVENCEVFRARIVELEGDLKCAHSMLAEVSKAGMALRAELSALKEQDTVGEVVGWYRLDRPYEMTSYPSVCATWHRLGAPVAPLYAAPVSEAKAQGVVMPEGWNVPRPMWKDARQPYGNPLNHADIEAAEKFNLALDEVARLNAAPVQQVSVPDGWKLVPVEPTLDMGWAYVDAANDASPGKRNSFNHFGYRAMLAAAPAPGGE